jgi:sulfite exporter TauE/SafE
MIGDLNLLGIFITGLLAGGISCMAVQGGLLATTLAGQASFSSSLRRQRLVSKTIDPGNHLDERLDRSGILSIVSFLLTRLLAYTVLGVILGWLGEMLQLSLQVQVGLMILVGIFMLGTALNMLQVHPVFRYFVIQPPHFLMRFVRKRSKSTEVFAPAVLGAFTVLIPCGVTQAMMALAVATASPLLGGLVMFVFILGTSPLFFVLGYLTVRLSEAMRILFTKFAAAVIILLAVYTLNNAVALTGSFWTLQHIIYDSYCVVSFCEDSHVFMGNSRMMPVAQETIIFGENGYTPKKFAVRAGSEVTLHLQNQGAGGCVQSFTIPSLNIQKVVPWGNSATVTFTAPKEIGRISFMCNAGLYAGEIEVI